MASPFTNIGSDASTIAHIYFDDGGLSALASIANGPDDPESPGNEDSAFGTLPEPSTALLLGLAGLALLRRRRARA